ncbi:zinc ribbon domain-containing protein [Moraxella sp. ZJ142]|uniref:zinc ribbon domain-containing protein n=1 Tax=Moraxella marmotae TaxID=3344520 RepID=UPI0035D47C1E
MTQITTHTIYSLPLSQAKLAQIQQLCALLGALRASIWHEFGSKPKKLNHRQIRDNWLACQDERIKGIPARLWKATLQDVIGDINARNEACKTLLVKKLYQTLGVESAKSLLKQYPFDKQAYLDHPLLHRLVRKLMPRGRTKVNNQIVVDTGCYRYFEHNGRSYLALQGLVKGKRIVIPLNCLHPTAIDSTIRLILVRQKGKAVLKVCLCKQVASKQDEFVSANKPNQIIGIDKGYSEVFTDSNGNRYGENLGELLSAHSDKLKPKYQRRNKLRALAEKYEISNPAKSQRIKDNNLGRQKLDAQKQRHQQQVQTVVYTACHQLAGQSNVIVAEDLSAPIKSKNYGKNQNRRLSAWVKGTIQAALQKTSQQYGVLLSLVNAAYTSQGDSQNNGLLTGKRVGDRFYRENGEVLDADTNAAKNILARHYDDEIKLWHSKYKVKAILQDRLRQSVETVQPVLQLHQSTERELLNNCSLVNNR